MPDDRPARSGGTDRLRFRAMRLSHVEPASPIADVAAAGRHGDPPNDCPDPFPYASGEGAGESRYDMYKTCICRSRADAQGRQRMAA